MEFDRDPFPPSLPHFDGTRILGESVDVAMEENGYDYNALNFDSPASNPYWEEATSYQSTAKPNGNTSIADNSTTLDAPFASQSPESSLPDSSSSDSSQNQHKRNHSSDSSQHGALAADGDIQMAGDTPMANGIVIGAGLVEDQVHHKPSPPTDLELSNRVMEGQFGFEAATATPDHCIDPRKMLNDSQSTKPVAMPYRISQQGGYSHGFGTSARVSEVSIYSSCSSCSIRHTRSQADLCTMLSVLPKHHSPQ